MHIFRKSILILFIMMGLASLGIYYAKNYQVPHLQKITERSFDTKLNQVHWFEYNADGELSQSFYAPAIFRQNDSDEDLIYSPKVHVHNEEKQWLIKAKYAKTKNHLQTIFLKDAVEIVLKKDHEEQPSILQTSRLVYHPKTQLAHTKAAVDFKQGDNLIHSQGLEADFLDKKTFKLGHVEGDLQAKQSTT